MDRKYFLERHFVLFCPEVLLASGLNQLGMYAYIVAASLEAAFEYVAHTELTTYLVDTHGFTFVGKDRITCDYKEFGELG